ncbi:unnamed protein product [Mytilus coruscus]|uniref:Transposase Tc1-like domain-containing protein n=1 Tax=Mytilus coruscus TaxID=42192 RepID=A0A6J7ZV18_MYTCO|nr:unnamed protein product [Mytilus coruscus]
MKTLTKADVQFVKRTLSSEPCTSSRTLHKRLLLKGSKVSVSTTKRAIVHAGFTCTKPRYCQMVRHVNKEKRVAFCKMLVENNDQFNDMIFSDECTVQLHQNKVYIYRRYDQVRPSLPKPKHPLKVHVGWYQQKRRYTHSNIRRYYEWSVLYRPHSEGHLPAVRQTKVSGPTSLPNGQRPKTQVQGFQRLHDSQRH